MTVDLETLAPKQKRPKGEPAASRSSTPTSSASTPSAWREVAKALGDPVRMQLVDVLRKHAGKVCVCELVPLFDLSQPTVSPPPEEAARRRHRRLRAAGPLGLLLRQPRSTGGAERMAELTRATDSRRRPARAAVVASATRRPRRARRHGERATRSLLLGRRRPRSRDAGSQRDVLRREPLRRATTARACPTPRRLASLGCGNPTAVAELHEGETVLDLGSGGGIDVLLSARRVGPTGKAYGLDMTDEMLELARAQPARGRRRERRVPQGHDRGDPAARRLGRRDHLQLRDQPLRRQGRRSSARPPACCGPGGRFAVSDVVADPDMDEATRARHAAVDRLHRRRADPRGVRARAARDGRLRGRSRSRRPIASTSTAASAIIRARVPAMSDAEIQLNDPQTLYRRLGGLAVERRSTIDLERDREQWAATRGGRARAPLLGALAR